MLKYKTTITYPIYKYITFFGQQPITIASSLLSNIPLFTIFPVNFIFFALYRH